MIAETTSFYVTGGTMPRGAPSYVARQADEELFDGLRHGEFCYVLTARQMGKSSLMVRTADRLRREGVAVAVLDLTAIGCNLTAEQWYAGLLAAVGRQLALEDETEAFWDSPGVTAARLGPLQRWMLALREVVLAHCPGPIVLFVDEIDVVRALPFSTDEFFAAIRECYNRRTEDPEFHRLAFCLLGVTTPSELIRDPRTTPFNIGRRIELNDFTFAEAMPLAAGLVHHGDTETRRGDGQEQGRTDEGARELLKRVLYWTGGHPCLTQRLCQTLAERTDADPNPSDPASLCAFASLREPSTNPVDQTCAETFLSHRAQDRDDNLNLVRERLLGGAAREGLDVAALLTLYEQVWRGRRVADDETDPLIAALRISGLVRVGARRGSRGVFLKVRNRIYAQVFDRRWIAARMPGAELQRQRAAYRRGLLRASAVAAVVLILLTGLTMSSVVNAREAQRVAGDLRLTKADLERALGDKEQTVRRLQDEIRERERQRRLAIKATGLAQRNGRQAARSASEARVQAEKAGRSARAAQLAKADAERWGAESQQRYVKLLTHQGVEALNDERPFDALLRWSRARALRPTEPEAERVRLASLLAQIPRIAWIRHEVRVANFSPAGRRLLLALGDDTVRLHDLDERRDLMRARHPAVGIAAASADGERLVTAGGDRAARAWKSNGELLAGPLQHAGHIGMVAVSPNGRYAVTLSGDADAIIWEVATGRPTAPALRHPESVVCAAFSPDSKRMVTASAHQLRIWDSRTGELLLGPFDGHQDIRALSFSPDGRWVLVQASRWRPMLFDARTGALAPSPMGDLCSTFSGDGRLLAAGSTGGRVHIVSLETGKEAVAPVLHEDAVHDVCFSPDSRHLASASNDGTARVWDAQSGEPVTPSLPHGTAVRKVRFSPDGRLLLTLDAANLGRVWELPGERPSHLVAEGKGLLAAVSRDGRRVVTANDKALQGWKTSGARREALRALSPPLQNDAAVRAVAISGNGRLAAAASGDGTIRVSELATGRLLHAFRLPEEVSHLAFSPAGDRLAAIRGDRIPVWNVRTGARLREFEAATNWGALTGVGFSADGKRIVVSGNMNSATVWDVDTGARLIHTGRHSDRILCSAFSPDGRILATAGADAAVSLWDTRTWEVLQSLPHAGPVVHLTFSPDGRRLLTASGNPDVRTGAARLWDVRTGHPAAAAMPHAGQVLHVAFSPDGRFAVTACADGTARVWEVATGDPVTPPLRHGAKVTMAAFLAGPERRVLTLSADGQARVWDLPRDRRSPEELVRMAELLSGRRVAPNGTLQALAPAELVARLAAPGEQASRRHVPLVAHPSRGVR